MRQRTIMITGGAGFLGQHLARHYGEQGWQVTVLDDLSCRNSTFQLEQLSHPSIKLVQGSIFDAVTVRKLVEENSYVVHFASVVGVNETIDRPLDTVHNLVGTLHLAESLTEAHVVLFGSSADVYGMHSILYSRPMHEDDHAVYEHPLVNRWVYPKVKALEENIIAGTKSRSIAARIFNCYGEEMDFPSPKRVIPHFLNCILERRSLSIHHTGEQIRCFCYYSDMIEGLVSALNYVSHQPPGSHSTFNLGNDYPISIRELAQLMIKLALEIGLLEHPLPIIEQDRDFYSQPFNDAWNRVPDLGRARNLLGCQPKVALEEGLLRTLRYYHHARPKQSAQS